MGESSKVPYNICDGAVSFNEIIERSKCDENKYSKVIFKQNLFLFKDFKFNFFLN